MRSHRHSWGLRGVRGWDAEERERDLHITGMEETGIMPGTKSNPLVRPRGQ